MNRNLRVLLIEPVPILQVGIKYSMIQLGCSVDTANDEKTGLEKALNSPYDVILIEIGQEKKLDGFNIVSNIKHQSIINKKTPIIALTVHQIEGQEEKANSLGITMYFAGIFTPAIAKKIYNYVKSKLDNNLFRG